MRVIALAAAPQPGSRYVSYSELSLSQKRLRTEVSRVARACTTPSTWGARSPRT
jgi:hypothetical protein